MRLKLNDFIDPELARHVEEARGENARRGIRRGPRDVRELREMRPAPLGGSTTVEANGRRVPVRIHEPRGRPKGVYLHFHGGGFYLGVTAQDDERDRRLADELGVVVVGVEYRLAPEHPWPAAPDDAETAARWLIDHAEERFGTRRMVIGGFSAGAALAVTTLLRLRDHPFAGAVLQFGAYDLSGLTPAGRLIADEYFIEAYAGHAPDRTVPDISPIYGDLRCLPPLLMVVGALDVVLEDNLAMAARVAAVGEVDLKVYPESLHGFTNRDTRMAQAARDDIARWLAARFS
ncbi:alpha/beta hydrolase [Lentzea sp. NEAU-D7]|uniref:alpha/beta hydrolase n=1 Tax=Lentzea sp. NEAU-D7 TaxID=2994667 RepID=UPI00224B3B92|nr:alpha/beta hydrolase fold domain-containing protein [Lentzea sp. NEAU-D7]MCX2951690.1 alpha/beta hydrolase fold domain-containing protein [Lentzea sp. NEAU-D7]